MRAVVHDEFGPPEVLRVDEVAAPTPDGDEVLVRVHATTVNRTDCGFRDPRPIFVRLFAGLTRPRHRILGTELSGVVEAVGPAVVGFAPGDRVFGVNADRFGAHAELVTVPASGALAHIPDGIGFPEAAAIGDGAVLALAYLRAVHTGPGQRIVIYGASGAIGTAAVQLADHLGAHVTAVCDTANVETVAALGPAVVVDRLHEDFADRAGAYDVIFDAVGKLVFADVRRALVAGGIFTATDLGVWWQNPALALYTRWFGEHRVLFPIPRYTREDVELLAGLVESGEFRPVIDRRYPLDEVVEATRYVETEQKVGNLVLVVVPDDEDEPH